MRDIALQLLIGILAAGAFMGIGAWGMAEWKEGQFAVERQKLAEDRLAAVTKARAEEQEKLKATELTAAVYKREKEDAEKAHAAVVADLKSRVRRMSVPVVSCPGSAPSGSPADPGKLEEAPRAELHPEAAIAIQDIGRDADQVTRDLNQCIDQLYIDRKEPRPWLTTSS